MRRSLGRGPRRVFGGYGPLLALAVGFVLMVSLVPTVAREQIVVRTTGGAPAAQAGTVPLWQDAPEARRTSGGTGGTAGGPAGPVTGAGRAAGTLPDACAGRPRQIPGDPYSPPCIAWPKGKDNGGATSRGVSRDTIRLSFRMPVENVNDLESVVRPLTGERGNSIPTPTQSDLQRTIRDYITYFEQRFQTYGRRIELVQWKGKGSALNELLGAGQEAAQADAIKAAKEMNVFADVSAFTQPYNDALARQHVVAIGAPYMSRQWFQTRQPYSWSPFPDCTTLGEAAADYLNKRVFGRPAAHAGPGLAGRPRKVAVIAPDNPEYQQCVAAGQKLAEAAGNHATHYSYTLDLARLSDQANNLAARIKADGITTVVLATDPVLPLLLAARMSQQSYYPEWVVMGTVLTDRDEIGQMYDQSQWSHAFGLSMLGEQQPEQASFAYAAAKSVDPAHEPAAGAELIYDFCYLVAIGIQMAGPDLTPETFAAGMHAYPGGTGPAGTWGFPDGSFTPYRDAREIWWDPTAVSPYNRSAGRYRSTGKRYAPGNWPAAPAAPEQLVRLSQEATTPPETR